VRTRTDSPHVQIGVRGGTAPGDPTMRVAKSRSAKAAEWRAEQSARALDRISGGFWGRPPAQQAKSSLRGGASPAPARQETGPRFAASPRSGGLNRAEVPPQWVTGQARPEGAHPAPSQTSSSTGGGAIAHCVGGQAGAWSGTDVQGAGVRGAQRSR